MLPISLILWIIGRYYRLNNLDKIKQYQGEFIGQILLNLNEISIHTTTKDIIYLSDVKKIEFKIKSSKGQFDGFTMANFYYENGLSNGTDNTIVITLKNGLIKKYQFELVPENPFSNYKQLIEHYYKIGIIGYLDSIDLLGLENREDWEKFKKLKT